jgi:hypothetical protein
MPSAKSVLAICQLEMKAAPVTSGPAAVVVQFNQRQASPAEALATKAFGLYEQFRPEIPKGVKGWRAQGVLDLELIKGLARSK